MHPYQPQREKVIEGHSNSDLCYQLFVKLLGRPALLENWQSTLHANPET